MKGKKDISKQPKRQLYQCFNAKVCEDRIVCGKGHKIGSGFRNDMPVFPLQRGDPLEVSTCQTCPDYDEMGERLEREDRGFHPTKALIIK